MSGFYKKAVVWLGLNEEYPEEFEAPQDAAGRPSPRPEHLDGQPPRAASEGQRPAAAPQGARPPAQRPPSQQPPSQQPPPQQRPQQNDQPLKARSVRDPQEGAVRAIPMEEEPARPANIIGTVRPLAPQKTVKPKVIIPQSFNDAQLVADTFREPKPVIVNMQNAERDLARRLIDFSSGLCYGLGGQMEKVARDVYLLTPDEVEVADEDRENY